MKKQTAHTKQRAPADVDMLFEVSWEACNKVGGIYTVLMSKAERLVSHYRNNYVLVGPYFQNKTKGEFQEQKPEERLQRVFDELEHHTGILCHFGTWLIKGEPSLILIDFSAFWGQLSFCKGNLWQWYGIDSLRAERDFDEPVLWAYAAGMLLEKIKHAYGDQSITAQFHEWLSGAGILYLKQNGISIGTVFTTHATTLARTFAYQNIDFYSLFGSINPDEEARKYNIAAKHQLEKQAALHCHVLTTVSEITSMEVEHFLGRKVDGVLPNGLDAKKFFTFEEITLKHQIQRNRLREFLLFYFFPYYAFDIEHTLFYFTAARYEFHAKGIDVYLKALANLNQRLSKTKTKRTIVAFIFVPGQTQGINPELIENRELFQDIKNSAQEVSAQTNDRLLYLLTEGKTITESALFQEDFLFEVKKKILRLKRGGNPPLSTHILSDCNDVIIRTCREVGLLNTPEDRVKIVFYPTYLTGHDGLANLSYEESIQACHLGVFPSFYEPWGYTPLEAMSFGVSAVTTDLAGFGRFCQRLKTDKKHPGIMVIDRLGKTDESVTLALTDILHRFALGSHEDRVKNKIQARALAESADWGNLVQNYINAHKQAVAKL
ncbi:MAG: Glycogen synthase [Parcubacteria group bacterium GW2011_GWA2_44_12]|nr:MAG: Glycogen synthase [Parcubacteria group bacterium GW2011_GWA2_44_12]